MDYHINPRHVRDLMEMQIDGDWFRLLKKPGALISLPDEPEEGLEHRTPWGERFQFKFTEGAGLAWFQWLPTDAANFLQEQTLYWSAWEYEPVEIADGLDVSFTIRESRCAENLLLLEVYWQDEDGDRKAGYQTVKSVLEAKILAEFWRKTGKRPEPLQTTR